MIDDFLIFIFIILSSLILSSHLPYLIIITLLMIFIPYLLIMIYLSTNLYIYLSYSNDHLSITCSI